MPCHSHEISTFDTQQHNGITWKCTLKNAIYHFHYQLYNFKRLTARYEIHHSQTGNFHIQQQKNTKEQDALLSQIVTHNMPLEIALSNIVSFSDG